MRTPPDSTPPTGSRAALRFGFGALGLGAVLLLAGWATGHESLLLGGALICAAGAIILGLP